MTVSHSPRGEHAGIPGRHWETALVTLGETVVEDDDSSELNPPPAANRETRRAARRTT